MAGATISPPAAGNAAVTALWQQKTFSLRNSFRFDAVAERFVWILQSGHFIIVLAFMSNSSLPEAPVLEDYVLSGTPMTDSENDIIEGPSRISLMCPIRLLLLCFEAVTGLKVNLNKTE
ncbi:putative RING/U-box superfamily protein [Tripterygium wilfordii]|uniref:Putative RING/U-box superfamily protein n=1 Tax=Tripterygium wilfordii TaxID=458696 RepID=A0A7J7CEN0_TRIWF|nr:putative RING/U-box superfamily protein [Tripterygium wilfordii]